MKKIILVLVLLLFTSGCYDYIELNELNIITGISVDYDKDYKVGFEILNSTTNDTGGNKITSYTVNGHGKTISEAFNNTSTKVTKKPYYSHLKVLIISEDIAKNHFKDIIDYFLRNPDIRNEFNIVIAKDYDALELLNCKTEENPVVSDNIENMLNANKYHKSNAVSNPFEETVTDILVYGQDTAMSGITIKDKELSTIGIGVFKNYKLKGFLTDEESITYNLLKNNIDSAYYTKKCDKGHVTFSIYNSDSSIEYNKNSININDDMKASIIEDSCGYDLKDTKVYEKLNKEYSQFMENKINNLLDKLIYLDADVLGINRTYYIKTKKKNNIWKDINYKVKVDLKINKKGLIFEVKDDN